MLLLNEKNNYDNIVLEGDQIFYYLKILYMITSKNIWTFFLFTKNKNIYIITYINLYFIINKIML